MPDCRAQLLAEVRREGWERGLEHERRSGGVIKAPDPPGLASELVERCASRLGVQRRGDDWPGWIYSVGLKYLSETLKGPRPSRVETGRPGPIRVEAKRAVGPKQPPRPRGRGRWTWAEGLAPAMQTPEVWVEFPMGSERSARVLAHKLKSGMKTRPPGRWEFCSSGNVFKARYLGAEEAVDA